MAGILIHFLNVFEVLIIIRVALSWITLEKGNPFSDFVFTVTEPILKIFRVIIPISKSMRIDISCIFALISINVLKRVILSIAFSN